MTVTYGAFAIYAVGKQQSQEIVNDGTQDIVFVAGYPFLIVTLLMLIRSCIDALRIIFLTKTDAKTDLSLFC